MQRKEILSNSQAEIQNKRSRKVALNRCGKLSFGAGEGTFLREAMCLRRKKKDKSKVLPRGFCLFDSEAEQRALRLLHIYCSDVRSNSSAPESTEQNPRDRALGLPFFFRLKHIRVSSSFSQKPPFARTNGEFAVLLQSNFAASFVLNYRLSEFLLSVFANCFELRWEPKRLMLLCYKICPC